MNGTVTRGELLRYWRQNHRVEIEAERIMLPKRRYKNPVYQRLANRWYGMVDTHRYLVRLRAEPPRAMRVPVIEPAPARYFRADAPPPTSVGFRTETYKFSPVAAVFEVPDSVWLTEPQSVIDRFNWEAPEHLRITKEAL